MNSNKLVDWYRSHREEYVGLVENCGSVSELMFKLEVYGTKWTKWDWVIFLSYLDWTAENVCDESPSPFPSMARYSEESQPMPEKVLLDDIFKELDSGHALDAVFSNKTVLMNMIDWLGVTGCNVPCRKYGILRLLAHVFFKFPELWLMNWMFIRHRGKNRAAVRTHRLEFALAQMAVRPREYFESPAFLRDFINRFWSKNGWYQG